MFILRGIHKVCSKLKYGRNKINADLGTAQKNQLTLNDNKGSSKLVQTTSQKKPHTSAKISPTNSNFICLECNKAYSTDYSLKRHRQVCPVRNGQEKNNGGGIRKRFYI
jgi:hypothetical protein